MIQAGVDVFRFNMSHGTAADHLRLMDKVRGIADELNTPVGILVDLQGPKVRTGRNAGGKPIDLHRGETLFVRGGIRGTDDICTSQEIFVDYPRIADELKRGGQILLDDGYLELRVEKRQEDRLETVVVRSGRLKEHAGVNFPGRTIGLKVPTRKDARDVEMAVGAEADFIALSFVQSAEDLLRLRRLVQKSMRQSKKTRSPAIVAKIEKPAALKNLDEILEETDGIMVARGDLGVEISLEKVPVWQKDILRRARAKGVFSITATQMLESMVQHSKPTRAEVSDVANAVFDGTDAIMLSAESAVGDHPIESVRMLSRIAIEAEQSLEGPHWPSRRRGDFERDAGGDERTEPIRAMARATIELAALSGARRIVVFTTSGRTGYILSGYRPGIRVICVTPSEATRRRLTLAWNTQTVFLPAARTGDELMQQGIERLRALRLVRKGDAVVILGGAKNLPEATNLLRWRKV